jgi:hypothetical protein
MTSLSPLGRTEPSRADFSRAGLAAVGIRYFMFCNTGVCMVGQYLKGVCNECILGVFGYIFYYYYLNWPPGRTASAGWMESSSDATSEFSFVMDPLYGTQ